MGSVVTSSVLMVAFHFPPAAMGSGHLRTLGFARHLPESGWDPVVLSARELAYPRTAPLQAASIPNGCAVYRALALDAGRHFAIAGKYPGFLAQPDRWGSWWPMAVWQGLRIIRRHRVSAIWSTYPIMTAHCIAWTLSRITKLPWVADFRDPMTSSVSPGNRFSVASQHRWEKRVLRDAAHVTFTTPSALQDYAARYPAAYEEGRFSVVENGYDESAFKGLPVSPSPTADRPLVLLHSGLLYPDGRNPFPFFTALARLKAAGKLTQDDVHVVLRASGSETIYARKIESLGLKQMVTLAPPVSNQEALAEQSQADALLLFQGGYFNRQIPAKLYEYLRIGQPILALVDAGGDTAAAARRIGGVVLSPIDDVDAIEASLGDFIAAVRAGETPHAKPALVATYSRRERAASLAKILAQVTNQPPSERLSASFDQGGEGLSVHESRGSLCHIHDSGE